MVTCGAKEMEIMSDTVRPCCRLLIEPNFFLMERPMSELQILYPVHFLRKNLEKRKNQKASIPKKGSCNFQKSIFVRYFGPYGFSFNKKYIKI